MRTIAPETHLRGARRAFARASTLLGLLSFVVSLCACEAPRGTIGAVIAQDDQSGRLFVRDAPPGLAAAKAGVENGDEILLIDGLDVRAMNHHQIHVALSGDVDATVKLTLIRKEQIVRVTLKRTEARKLIKSPSSE
ncbi:MAG TPA: PDZ domain-containing protein [Polyangiaceae bacterium]|jgi:C-terminal processing protease CtpA/Prc|nr:PDZ domain-containing protein [Polyangiaceae bacterium]